MDLLYKGDTLLTYALSIAATWVGVAAIFVSPSMAYYNGLYGWLWYLIPNFLTLLLFGYVTHYFVNNNTIQDGVNITNFFNDKRQRYLHSIVSAVLNILMTASLILGVHSLNQMFFPNIEMWKTAVSISMFCYVYTKLGGLKGCVISDKYKYYILVLIGIFLVIMTGCNVNISDINFFGRNNPNFIDITLSFGIISAIGLFASPLVDNSLYQRVFCVEKKNIFLSYVLGAILFIVIPICFGSIGFLSTSLIDSETWNITSSFGNDIYTKILLGIAIFCALISTLDSNLCSIYSLTSKLYEPLKNVSMELALILSSAICIIFEPTIVQIFLLYGTVRTALAFPTLLVIFNRCDTNRLFYATLIATVIGSIGFITMNVLGLPYGYVFTIFALLFPLIGIKI